MAMVKPLFSEVQNFRHNLLWTLALMVPATVMIGILIYQLSTGELVGDRPMSNLSLGILCFFYVIPITLIIPFVKLVTVIDHEKISYGWNIPTSELNELSIAEIQEWSIIRYRFVGYGYRLSRLYGTVYNVNGDQGLQIVTTSGSKILIGTHHAEQLKAVLERIKPI
jgi:hypothetical protein